MMGEKQLSLFRFGQFTMRPADESHENTAGNGARTALREPARPDPLPPRQPGSESSAAGARYMCGWRRNTVAGMILNILRERGPVSADGSRGGATIDELADEVSHRRGVPTMPGTICGRIAGANELAGLVRKSGRRRPGRAGVENDVYELQK